MEAGLEVRNADNSSVLIIDSNFRNLAYVGKVLISCVTRAGNFYYGEFSSNRPFPFIAVEGAHRVFVTSRRSGSNWINRVHNFGGTATVACHIFDDVAATVRDNVGLEIFNAAGEIVFSSATRYCRVIGAAIGSNPQPGVDGWATGGDEFLYKNFIFVGTSRICVVQNILFVDTQIGGGSILVGTYSVLTFVMTSRTSGNMVTLAYNLYLFADNLTTPSGPTPQLNYNYLFIDASQLE